jgi:hypothetical protein
VNPLAIRLESRPEPADGLAARLSFQHAMAAAFVDGACLPAFSRARRIVVKVGSSLVTNRWQGLDRDALARWASQIARLRAGGMGGRCSAPPLPIWHQNPRG